LDISWPHVRQIILNDRLVGYKPDRSCLNRFASELPDVKFLGFGRYYEYHWYIIVESKYFPAFYDPVVSRGAIPATSLFKELQKLRAVTS
jgi:hypothetical protein